MTSLPKESLGWKLTASERAHLEKMMDVECGPLEPAVLKLLLERERQRQAQTVPAEVLAAYQGVRAAANDRNQRAERRRQAEARLARIGQVITPYGVVCQRKESYQGEAAALRFQLVTNEPPLLTAEERRALLADIELAKQHPVFTRVPAGRGIWLTIAKRILALEEALWATR